MQAATDPEQLAAFLQESIEQHGGPYIGITILEDVATDLLSAGEMSGHAELKTTRAQRDEFRAQLEHSERENERLHMIAELIAAYRKANPEDIAHRIYVDIEGILNGECDD